MAKPRKISAHEAQAVAALITAIATCEETLTLSVEEIGVLDDPDPELGQALGKLVRMGEYGDCWAFEVAPRTRTGPPTCHSTSRAAVPSATRRPASSMPGCVKT